MTKKSLRIESPPKKGSAQNLLYDLQQMTYFLVKGGDQSSLRKPAPMEEGVKVKGGASENYKRMGRFGSMVYYWIIKDDANYLKFRQQTLNFIRDERIRGHMGGEQGCSQPHDGMHLAATFLAHLFAIKTNDSELLIETEWWISSYLLICQVCYYPLYNRVLIPGFRIKQDPISENRDIIFQHLVLGKSLKSIETVSDGWRDKYTWQRFYLPVYLAVELRKEDTRFQIVRNHLPTLALPKLYAPMNVKRERLSHLRLSLEIPPNTRGKSETVEWIDFTEDNIQYGRADGIIENMSMDRKEKKKVTSEANKIPTSKAELDEVSNLPFNVANGLIAQADKTLVKSWGEELYSNFGKGYLHSSDHYAALTILLEREPSFKEVYDSYHISGSKNIDLARNKVGGGARPTEWDSWTDSQKMQAVLTQLYGIKNGARILDGVMKDPDPEKTKALMKLWGLNEPKEPDLPKEPDKPTPEPPAPAPEEEIGILITINGKTYKGIVQEVK